VQLALVQRRSLAAAAFCLMFGDDLRRDINKMLLLVVFDEVQALEDRRGVRAAGWQGGFGALVVRGSRFCCLLGDRRARESSRRRKTKGFHLQRGDDVLAFNHRVSPYVVHRQAARLV
jgi:hypothetical protein